MALRNFWVDAEVDGYQTELSGDPRRKDGGMTITVYQRNKGEKETAVSVICTEEDGKLTTTVWVNGKSLKYETER